MDNQKIFIKDGLPIEKSAATEKKHNTVLQRAFHKYGIENFSFTIIEECSNDKLDEKEIFYISTMKPEYNMNLGGSGNTGYKVTEKTKEILKKLGKRQWNSYDAEKKQNIIKNQLIGPRKGSHRSEETKTILSEKTKEYFIRNNGMSDEQKKKISDSLKGKKRPNFKHYKSVIGISENNVAFYFTSVKYAAFILDINYSAILHCLRGDRPKAGKFTWKYCSPETIRNWSREELITSRSAMHPTYEDEDIVHAIVKDKNYGVHDKGLIALARRSNTIKTIAAEPIYENDIFDVELGMNRHLSHKMDITKERGEVIGYYCLVELTNGGTQFHIMSKKDAENHRDKFSKAYKKDDKDNIWNKNFDAMALKSCVIQTLKLCPISVEALDAVSREEMNDIVATDEDFSISDEDKEASVTVEPASPVETKSQVVNQIEEKPVEPPKLNITGISEEEENLAEQAFNAQQSFDNGDIF